MANAESTLTVKQALFVQEFDGNGTQAAIRAGYGAAGARVAAYRLLTNVAISSAIQARQAADAARLSIRRGDVVKGLLEAVEQARVQSNPMGMVAGLRELAKLMGFYPDSRAKVDVSVAVTGNVNMDRLSRLSDAELLKIIADGTATAAF